MVSSTLGSPTKTCWKRRSSAGSFSIRSRYSSSVVAPIIRSSPRASIGLSMLPASIAESPPAPAPTTVCSSSMKVITWPLESLISSSTALSRSSNSPRYFAPATIAARSRLEQPPALEGVGHVAGDDPLGEALDDGGLADAGLADQHRVVLGTPRQHLDHPADLGVAADHRVELAVLGRPGEVDGVLLQALVRRLRLRAGHPAVAAERGEPLAQPVRREPGVGEQRPRGRLDGGQADQQVLGRDVVVLHRRGQVERPREHAGQRRRGRRLLDGGAAGLRQRLERALGPGGERRGVGAGLADQLARRTVGVAQQRREQVDRLGLGVARGRRRELGGLDRLTAARGELLGPELAHRVRRSPTTRGGAPPSVAAHRYNDPEVESIPLNSGDVPRRCQDGRVTRTRRRRRSSRTASSASPCAACSCRSARVSGFGMDKPGGTPCPNLADDDRCRIHATLREDGWSGCVTFDCFGAGPAGLAGDVRRRLVARARQPRRDGCGALGDAAAARDARAPDRGRPPQPGARRRRSRRPRSSG